MSRLLLTMTLMLLASTTYADEGYMLGLNLLADDADGFGASVFGQLSLTEDTSISGAFGTSTTDVSDTFNADSINADIGIDHRFGLLGARLTAAYWGDSDILDSRDLRGSLYLSGDVGSVGIAYEDRDLEFQLPPSDFFNRTSFPFGAKGWGLNARLNLSDGVDVYASGMDYDYSVAFLQQASDRIRPLLVITRLSILSSLADWKVSGGIGVDIGDNYVELDVARWEGAVTGSSNDSVTLSFLTPLSRRVDMEISLGLDRSELFGDATIGSLRFYYYGGTID